MILSRLSKTFSIFMALSETDHSLQKNKPHASDESLLPHKDTKGHACNHLADALWAIAAVCVKPQALATVKAPCHPSDGGNSVLAFHKCPCQCSPFVLSAIRSALYSAENL